MKETSALSFCSCVTGVKRISSGIGVYLDRVFKLVAYTLRGLESLLIIGLNSEYALFASNCGPDELG